MRHVSSPPLPVHPSLTLPAFPWVARPYAAGTSPAHEPFGSGEPCLHYIHSSTAILYAISSSHHQLLIYIGKSYLLVSRCYSGTNLLEILWVEPTTKLFYSEFTKFNANAHLFILYTQLGNMRYTYVHTYAQTHKHDQ